MSKKLSIEDTPKERGLNKFLTKEVEKLEIENINNKNSPKVVPAVQIDLRLSKLNEKRRTSGKYHSPKTPQKKMTIGSSSIEYSEYEVASSGYSSSEILSIASPKIVECDFDDINKTQNKDDILSCNNNSNNTSDNQIIVKHLAERNPSQELSDDYSDSDGFLAEKKKQINQRLLELKKFINFQPNLQSSKQTNEQKQKESKSNLQNIEKPKHHTPLSEKRKQKDSKRSREEKQKGELGELEKKKEKKRKDESDLKEKQKSNNIKIIDLLKDSFSKEKQKQISIPSTSKTKTKTANKQTISTTAVKNNRRGSDSDCNSKPNNEVISAEARRYELLAQLEAELRMYKHQIKEKDDSIRQLNNALQNSNQNNDSHHYLKSKFQSELNAKNNKIRDMIQENYQLREGLEEANKLIQQQFNHLKVLLHYCQEIYKIDQNSQLNHKEQFLQWRLIIGMLKERTNQINLNFDKTIIERIDEVLNNPLTELDEELDENDRKKLLQINTTPSMMANISNAFSSNSERSTRDKKFIFSTPVAFKLRSAETTPQNNSIVMQSQKLSKYNKQLEKLKGENILLISKNSELQNIVDTIGANKMNAHDQIFDGIKQIVNMRNQNQQLHAKIKELNSQIQKMESEKPLV
jgi:hypothetical protein